VLYQTVSCSYTHSVLTQRQDQALDGNIDSMEEEPEDSSARLPAETPLS